MSKKTFENFLLCRHGAGLLLMLAMGAEGASPAEPQAEPSTAATSVHQSIDGRDAVRKNRTDDDETPRETIPWLKLRRYVDRLLARRDLNGDGELQPAESGRMQGDPQRADFDGDGLITREELTRHVAQYGRDRRIRPLRLTLWDQESFEPLLNPTTPSEAAAATDVGTSATDQGPGGRRPTFSSETPLDDEFRRGLKFFVPRKDLPDGLPDWFIARDANGDAQVTMAEFSRKATRSELQQFTRYDLDGDHVITASEYLRAVKQETAP